MKVSRALLIVNPAARRAARALPVAQRAFAARAVAVDTVPTERAGHARTIAAARAAAYDAVFSLGGDGTAMDILEVATAAGRPVGILPGGTGNLVARALGIPIRIESAVHALLDGTERRIDLGVMADGRCFAFGAGVGVDVTMLQRASPGLKRRFGVLAYFTAAVGASFRHEPFHLVATVDGGRHTFQAAAAMVLNFGTVLGGLLQLGPNVSPDDGVLDLCVFAPRTVGDVFDIGWKIVRHQLADAPHMHFLKGRQIVLETTPPRVVQADGELLGHTPLSCEVRPGGARVLVPARP